MRQRVPDWPAHALRAAFKAADGLDKQSNIIEGKVIDAIDGELIDIPAEDIKQISSDINNKFLESIVDE